MMNENYFKYWGKAKPSPDGKGPEWHPLVYHSLDVAAVGFEYLKLNKNLAQYFCNLLHCSEEDLCQWGAFWLALHDLGKFSEAFQSQKFDLFTELQGRNPNSEKQYTERHDSLGQWLWKDWLSDQVMNDQWFGNDSANIVPSLDIWMRAVTGHHGQPPKVSNLNGISDDFFSKQDRKVVQNFVDVIRKLFLSGGTPNIPFLIDLIGFEHVSQKLSWWFAGLSVLADWLGSNTNYFPYQTDEMPLSEYWKHARQNATQALKSSGVVPQAVRSDQTFYDLFPNIKIPSPLQKWSINVEVSGDPQIYLLEDVTGAGKTEAALNLAYRLISSGNATGFFVALPTMATANAMYDRIANVYGKLFSDDANLVLAHGSRDLVEKFARTVVPESSSENDIEQNRDETASARCSAWLADHNKRSLLAQAGVGTIDQALLSVLHSKHQSLRLLGLFKKILIVDEVHACDAYMQGVLEVLLEFHARSGGSAILLSATLPNQMKQSLLRAYARGCEAKCPGISNNAYPLATWWNSAKAAILNEEALATRKSVERTVTVDYRYDLLDVVEAIKRALDSGQCVCWIRNTVADAMDAYLLMTKHASAQNITLYHARFTLSDRLDIEKNVLDHFGSESLGENRAGRLVIATQVIEQSLDVDFDLMVSDLAPIDRLIQRAGRLQRHVRDASGHRLKDISASDLRGEPRLIVFAPEWVEEPQAGWFKKVFPKAGMVYPDHSQLWLTAKALKSGKITMPTDARNLIEGVFGDESAIPTGLKKANLTVQGQQMADASMAKCNTLTFSAGYTRGDVVDWWSEAKTPSRLGEASTNIVLARWEEGRLVPWANRVPAWAYSMVRISARSIEKANELTDPIKLMEYQRVLDTLPDKGKWSVLLALERSPEGLWKSKAWTATDKNDSAKLLTWQYDAASGLQRGKDNQAIEEIE